MGFLRSGQNTTITTYSGLQVQTTSSALPIPICYGENIVAPNVLWYENFQQHPGNGAKGGGKGGGAGATSTYSCDIIMGVCEGPVASIGNVWQTTVTPTTLGALGLSFFNGATPQAVWSYLAAAYPSQALAYNGTCYVAQAGYNLGGSATVADNNFEVRGILHGTGCNGLDADPSLVIQDFLTNPQYGVGFPPASLNAASLLGASGGSSYQAYCWAAGLAISPVLNSQEQAMTILARWLQITNSTAVWSGGMLKIIPFADEKITGNGWTFTPDVSPLYSLGDDDYVFSANEDPVKVTRSDPYSLANYQSIEIQGRLDNYNTGPVTAFDQSMIDRFGLRVGSTVTAHEITDLGIAQTAAQLILQRGLYVRNSYKFKLSMEFCLLDPMDLVALTDSGLGLDNLVVRITEIDEADDGSLEITAEEFPQGIATSVVYPTQGRSNGAPDTSVVPNPVNAPVIVEPPPSLTQNAVQLWIGVSPRSGDPNWGGCVVSASLDGTSYATIATIKEAAKMGVLTSAIPAYAGANPDATDTLAVDLGESLGSLESSTGAAAAAGVSLCLVGEEFLSYTTSTMTAANKYNLTGLYRGLYGVASTASATGATFCLLDSAILKYSIPAAEIGDLIYLKFQSFNIFGAALEELSDCAAYTYQIQGSGTLGPVASALAIGTAMDFGHVAGDAASENDDYGNVASVVTAIIDLGNCTS